MIRAAITLRLLISSFYDPGDKDAWARMSRGENTGSLWEWHAGSGMRRLEIGGISGANGVAISADGNTFYASAWSGSELLVLDCRTGASRAATAGWSSCRWRRSPLCVRARRRLLQPTTLARIWCESWRI